MYTCSAARLTLNKNMCGIETGHTTDSSSKSGDNSTNNSSSKNTDNSATNISSENGNNSMSNKSATDSSSKDRNNSTVQTSPKKSLKLSLSKKQHSYQVYDPPVNANCSNENKTTSQAHRVTQVHVRAPQDTIRCTQTQQFTRGQFFKDITNTINHTKEVHVHVVDSSVTSISNPTKSPLPQDCTKSCTPALFDHDSTTTTNFKSVLSWKQLAIPLQTVLPNDAKYTYVIEDFQPKSNEEFEGAPMHCFEAVIRINLTNEEEANQWIQDMMVHSLTTYRITRTTSPGLKRVQCKLEMHCQHYRKPLTKKTKTSRCHCKIKKIKMSYHIFKS